MILVISTLLIIHNIICSLPGITVFQEIAKCYCFYNLILSILFLFTISLKKKKYTKLHFLVLFIPTFIFLIINIKRALSFEFNENLSLRDFIVNSVIKADEREESKIKSSEILLDYSKDSNVVKNNPELRSSLRSIFPNEVNCNFETLKIYSRVESYDRDSSHSEEQIPVEVEDYVTSKGYKLKIICFKLMSLNSRYNLFKNRVIIRRVGSIARFRESPMIVLFEYEGTTFNFHYRMFKWVSRMNQLYDLSEKGRVKGLFGGRRILVWG